MRILDCFSGVGGNAIAFASSASVARVVGVEIDGARADASLANARVYGVREKLSVVRADVFAELERIAGVSSAATTAAAATTAPGPDATGPVDGGGGGGGAELRAAAFDGVRAELRAAAFDGVFMSPPWGGPEYKRRERFDVADMRLRAGAAAGEGSHADPDIVRLLELSFAACPVGCVAVYLPRNTDMRSLRRVCARLRCRAHVERNWLGVKLKAITVYFRRP